MLLAITDRRLMGPDPLARIEALFDLLGAKTIVQIREKDLATRTLTAWIERLLPRARDRGARLVVNDRADLALAFEPDLGVHLPEDGLSVADARSLLGSGIWIGASRHSAEGASAAASEGADLVTIGPVFETPSKAGILSPIGIESVRAASRAVREIGAATLVFGLGGVDAGNASLVRAAGADGVAAIRAVWERDARRHEHELLALAGP